MLAFCWTLQAQSVDDAYVRIHALITEGDALAASGQSRQAVDKYTEAHTALMNLQRGYPEWSTDVVKFRLGYLEGKINELRPQAPTQPAAGDKPGAPRVATPAEIDAQVAGLRQEIARLNEEKSLLEAKLKEALAAQPAAVDPRELERAQQKIVELQKSNELLQVTVTELETKAKAGVNEDALKKSEEALKAANAELDQQKTLVANLTQEKEALQNQLRNQPKAEVDTTELQKAQAEVEQAKRQLASQTEKVAQLEQEKQALQAAAKNQQPAAPAVDVAALQNQLAEQKAVIDRLTREKDLLQGRVQSPTPESDIVLALKARIAILETQKIPFTPEELALMTAPKTDIPATPTKTAARQPLATAAPLLAEAQRHFAAGEYNQAEQKYQRAIEMDDQNPMALANLAVIQAELNKLDEAEKNVRKAIALSPEDGFSYSTLGQVLYRKKDYDAAAEALSRAAQLDPKSAEIQSRLGIVLSQKGLRGPAEAAFRKALQVQPGYAPAHLNLAVLYASQQPPLGELAQWHYQKAVKAGSPKNPELEKLIETARAAAPK